MKSKSLDDYYKSIISQLSLSRAEAGSSLETDEPVFLIWVGSDFESNFIKEIQLAWIHKIDNKKLELRTNTGQFVRMSLDFYYTIYILCKITI